MPREDTVVPHGVGAGRGNQGAGKELKRRGWTYVGPTTMYAFMQAAGIVNDHMDGCHARDACDKARAKFKVPKVR